MENYICINGKMVELTKEQLIKLGITLPDNTPVINGYTLNQFLQVIRDGKAQEVAKARDVMKIGDFEFEIIGFNHDISVIGGEHPTVTFMMKNKIPRRRMHGGACPDGYAESELRKWLNETFIKELPEELTAVISETVRSVHNSKGNTFSMCDKLFIPTESEYFGSSIYSPKENGDRYEAFATSEDRIRLVEDGDGMACWTCSPFSGHSTGFVFIRYNGLVYADVASYAYGVPVCFQLS